MFDATSQIQRERVRDEQSRDERVDVSILPKQLKRAISRFTIRFGFGFEIKHICRCASSNVAVVSQSRARFNVSSRALSGSTTIQCVATTQVIIYITILFHLCRVEFRLFPLASRIINIQAALAHRELGFVDVGRALQRGV